MSPDSIQYYQRKRKRRKSKARDTAGGPSVSRASQWAEVGVQQRLVPVLNFPEILSYKTGLAA